MMTLFDLKKGDTARVTEIHTDGSAPELKARLFSFGVRANTTLTIQEISLTRKTVKIKVGNSMLALRSSEAKSIRVVAL